MPRFLESGQKQFTTEQANASRICTKIRYVVEARKRSLKKHKFFRSTICNMNTPSMLDDLRFVAACINMFEPVLITDNDDCTVAERILVNQDKPNGLNDLVKTKGLTRKKIGFIPLEEAQPAIRSLDKFHLSRLGGSYQLGLAISYYSDHLWKKDVSGIEAARLLPPGARSVTIQDLIAHEMNASYPVFVRARLQSRHTSGTEYMVYVLLDGDKEGHHCVVEFCCSCKSGLRTTDCCAHTLCLIWYLTNASFLSEIPTVGEYLRDHFPASVVATAFSLSDL